MAKRKTKRTKKEPTEKIHNHIHINIGDKKPKTSHRRKRSGGGGGGRGGATSIQTSVAPPNIVMPQYNKPQYLDTSTAVNRERPFRTLFEDVHIPHLKHSAMLSQEPEPVAPTMMTTQEPELVATTVMTSQEPETVAPTMMTTQEPENATAAAMTTQTPDNVSGGGISSGYEINPFTGRVVKIGGRAHRTQGRKNPEPDEPGRPVFKIPKIPQPQAPYRIPFR